MRGTTYYKSRFRILKGGKVSLMITALLGSTSLCVAAPQGGSVTSGKATISQSGHTTNIVQSTKKASINWKSFNIAKQETVNFKQPSKNAITLNRVIGNEKSIINGALNANGQVWILNSNGVLFGKNASINTAGIMATTKNLSDEDFQAGKYHFKGDSKASIINLGAINVTDKGYAALLADHVSNQGVIKAVKGSIQLVGAKEAIINLNGNSLVELQVTKGVVDALVENKGALYNDAGEIYLTTNAVDELLKGVVNNEGIIEANSLDDITGHVELFAHGGEVQVGGSIQAQGGFVETSGREFVFNDMHIEAGQWLIDPVDLTIDTNLASAIESQLSSGDVTIQTTDTQGLVAGNLQSSDTSGEGNIIVQSDIAWSSNSTLTLDAWNDILIHATIDAGNDGHVFLKYGQATATGADTTYDFGLTDTFAGKINLGANSTFKTKQGTTGAEIDWVIIRNIYELQALTGSFNVLGADINPYGIGFTPISMPGYFDGLGHVITDLYVLHSNLDNVGLFSIVEGQVQNIGIESGDIRGHDNVGGLVGALKGIVKNAYSNAHVSGSEYVGGLIGKTERATVDNSFSYAIIYAPWSVGGLIGYSELSEINNSHATPSFVYSRDWSGLTSKIGGLVGYSYDSVVNNSFVEADIIGTNDIGGLIGESIASEINHSYVIGDVIGAGDLVGGLVGDNDSSTIKSSYFIGNVSGRNYVGGIAGGNYNSTIQDSYSIADVTGVQNVGGLSGHSYINALIENSYSIGNVQGDLKVGGLVGFNRSDLLDSYAVGVVTGNSEIGGLIGSESINSSVSNTYYDSTVNPGMADENLYGKSSEQLQRGLDNIFASWDNTIWGFSDDISDTFEGYQFVYPYLKDVTQQAHIQKGEKLFENGFGTDANPYGVSSWEQLNNLRLVNDGSKRYDFKLLSNLDENTTGYNLYASNLANGGKGWDPLDDYYDSFDGNNLIISDLYINRPDEGYIGLFGFALGIDIKNLGVVDANIVGDHDVGSVAGKLHGGSVNNVYSYANVHGQSEVGGFIGATENISMTNIYSMGNVVGQHNVGGLIGEFTAVSTLQDAYSNVHVTGNTNVGGLIGLEDTSSVTNAYYDSTINPGMADESTYGMSSKQLQSGSDKIFANWDDTVWELPDNFSDTIEGYQLIYPYLKDVTQQVHIQKGEKLFENGFGTDANPYGISSWEQLNNLRLVSSDYLRIYDFKLLNNLDENTVGYKQYASSLANGGKGWNPLDGVYDSFDGNNLIISDLYINRPNEYYTGLFGSARGSIITSNDFVIKNLGLENANIVGEDYVGTLSGSLRTANINNVYTSTSVRGNEDVGGLVGHLGSVTVSNVYVLGNVTGNYNVGGLIGRASDWSKSIENAYTNVNVLGSRYVGGLVGDNNTVINNAYALGNVEGDMFVGGVLGATSTFISNLYFSGTLSANNYFGGVVGQDRGFYVTNANAYYNKNLQSGLSDENLYGKTTAEIQSLNQTIHDNWDFDTVWSIDSRKNKGLPYFKWQTFATPSSNTPTQAQNALRLRQRIINQVVQQGQITLRDLKNIVSRQQIQTLLRLGSLQVTPTTDSKVVTIGRNLLLSVLGDGVSLPSGFEQLSVVVNQEEGETF